MFYTPEKMDLSTNNIPLFTFGTELSTQDIVYIEIGYTFHCVFRVDVIIIVFYTVCVLRTRVYSYKKRGIRLPPYSPGYQRKGLTIRCLILHDKFSKSFHDIQFKNE